MDFVPLLNLENTPFVLDAEFAAIFPAPDAARRQELKDTLEREGIRDAYVVWHETNILLDGYTREELRLELIAENKPIALPQVKVVSLPDRLAALEWIFKNQFVRRNCTPKDRAAAVLMNQPLMEEIEKINKERQEAGVELPEGIEPKHTDDYIAEFAGCSTGTVWNAQKDIEEIMSSGEPEIIAGFTSNDPETGTNITQAKKKLQLKREHDKRDRQREKARNIPLDPPPSNAILDTIILADCVQGLTTIPDGSVTLTITSPPYTFGDLIYENEDANFVDYRTSIDRLAKTFTEVFRATKASGRAFINIDATNNREEIEGHKGKNRTRLDVAKMQCLYADTVSMMRDIGWHFGWEHCWYKQNSIGSRPNWGTYSSPACPTVRRQHEYILGFHKGPAYLEGDKADIDITDDEFEKFTMSHWYIKPTQRKHSDDPDYHPCPYPEEIVYRLARLYSYRGDTILDPYSGSGTTSFVAKALGRRYIGIDNGPSYVASALRRLATLDGLTTEAMVNAIHRHVLLPDERSDGYGFGKKTGTVKGHDADPVLSEVKALAVQLMTTHNLIPEWNFKWLSATKRRLGHCAFGKKIIGLNHKYAKVGESEDVKDVLLHEIAHALAGPNARHGKEWKEMCVKIGADPKRLKTLSAATRRKLHGVA